MYTLEMDAGERLFEIATESVKPSYISFWTALSHHGLTEQQVMTVQLVSTIQDRGMMIDPYMVKVTRFKPERFFGYVREDRYAMGDVEKVLVDSLFLPDRCGGIDEFTRCLKRAWDGIDRNRFARYLIRFGNRSVISRAGHLMDVLELEGEEVRSMLKRYRSSGYVKLVPGRGEVRGHDHVWNVIVNHEIAGGGI